MLFGDKMEYALLKSMTAYETLSSNSLRSEKLL